MPVWGGGQKLFGQCQYINRHLFKKGFKAVLRYCHHENPKTKKIKLKSKCTQLATHVQIRTESNDTNEMPEPTGAIFVSVELNNFLELQQ